VIILQKKILNGSAWRVLRKKAKRVVYDLDDAIWMRPKKAYGLWSSFKIELRLKRILAESDAVCVANKEIGWGVEQRGAHAEVVPMALDQARWQPLSRVKQEKSVTLGWAGGPGNLHYVESIFPQLSAAYEKNTNLSLAVFCGAVPKNSGMPMKYHAYDPDLEATVIQNFDLGLLPLPDGKFERAKSPIKALQYAACGIATLSSPVGAVKELIVEGETGFFVEDGNWERAVLTVAADRVEWQRRGVKARKHFESFHSTDVVFPRIRQLLLP